MSNEEGRPDETATQHFRLPPESRSTMDEGRFPPGSMLAQRYRVVSIVGRGGMGEVYRANDLMVGQTVALKFLPEHWAKDEAVINRFRNEVRTARMVSHPNVCRVHDLAEADGRLFLTMEFIDGEDLSSLIRRIGRLPEDKALEIARKLCAGLQAAHDKGIIHRDLKPGNVMIDQRGEVIITDFGLAGVSGSIHDVTSGTPAYMSPEQRTGKEVTFRSDIFALGVLLHEVFTGKRPDSSTTSTSAIKPDIGRVLDLCRDPDPSRRPASAFAVARALPGGDPLAASLAAGQIPSPEMVAQAGEHTGLRPLYAAPLVVLPVLALLLLGWTTDFKFPVRTVPPEELRIQARDLVRRTGNGGTPNEAYGLTFAAEIERAAAQKASDALWTPNLYWYRTSPVPLGVLRTASTTEIGPEHPPLTTPGMALVILDLRGKLIRYEAVPEFRQTSPGRPPDWDGMLTAAGIDKTRLDPVSNAPSHVSWNYRDAAGLHYEIDGFAEEGWLRRFRVRGEWESTLEGSPWPWRLEAFLTLAAVVFAFHNYRRGRTDLRGAGTLAAFVFTANLGSLLLRGGDLLHWRSQITPIDGIGLAVLRSLMFGTAFFAMEPYLRRHWPVVLVTWTRLLHGEWKDATVGRDILIGMAASGFTLSIWAIAVSASLAPIGGIGLQLLQSTPWFLASLVESLNQSVSRAVTMTFLLFLFRLLLRRDWAACAVVTILFTALLSTQIQIFHPAALVVLGIVGIVQVFITMRFGFLAKAASEVVVILSGLVRTVDPSNWFAVYCYLAIAWAALLALAAFRLATAGHKLLAEER